MKALIAMSGGVDSSVAALIMKEKGYECIGCTMKLNENLVEDERGCCTVSDVEDARSVADRLGMEYYVFNYKEDFKKEVIDRFCESYIAGFTPNPCIECNERMKFGRLRHRAKELGCDKIVTGHYARIEKQQDKYVLLESKDLSKDQSYVLYRMTQEELAVTCFPLGEMDKDTTRGIASDSQLINANKKDSQDICFVPDGDYASVVEKYNNYKSVPGDFVLLDGTVVGKHKGIIHYTIGQRKGLGIAWTEPLYVVEIDVKNNRVILGSNDDLFKTTLMAGEVNWISGEVPLTPIECYIRTRYHGKKVAATVTPMSNNTFRAEFKEPVRAITPGQAAVMYDGDRVLGGGIILPEEV